MANIFDSIMKMGGGGFGLAMAASTGMLAAVEQLIKSGADVNEKFKGYTPLKLAKEALVKEKKKTNRNSTDELKIRNLEKIIEVLVKAGGKEY